MSATDLFSGPAPRVFTLPAGAPFLSVLARGLTRAFPDPGALAGVTVLAPTRRAGRALAEAFAGLDGGPGAALLPMIRPIGDVDADDPRSNPVSWRRLRPTQSLRPGASSSSPAWSCSAKRRPADP